MPRLVRHFHVFKHKVALYRRAIQDVVRRVFRQNIELFVSQNIATSAGKEQQALISQLLQDATDRLTRSLAIAVRQIDNPLLFFVEEFASVNLDRSVPQRVIFQRDLDSFFPVHWAILNRLAKSRKCANIEPLSPSSGHGCAMT